ncbi:phage holin family protein [uncultured Arthrobacter sp.]|uniref:phage holin family protein n=1 Tax=uncultured Arthrobacter sp. TaxID=114050 RepID=UPI002611D47A|nr:phage holin family protein [uncultured Arthrobacter sp.]
MTETSVGGAHQASARPGPDTATGGADRSLGDILGEVTKDLSTLMRQEVALAKAEATESAKNAGKSAGMFAGAAVGGHFLLLFLSLAAMWGLGELMALGWAALIVAAVWAIIAAILALTGKKEMKKVKGLPQTAETIKEIPPTLKPGETR